MLTKKLYIHSLCKRTISKSNDGTSCELVNVELCEIPTFGPFKGILGGLVLTSELFNIIGRSVLLQHISFRFDIKQRVDIIRRRALTKSVVCSGRTVIFLLTLTALMPMTRISIIIYNQLTEADQG